MCNFENRSGHRVKVRDCGECGCGQSRTPHTPAKITPRPDAGILDQPIPHCTVCHQYLFDGDDRIPSGSGGGGVVVKSGCAVALVVLTAGIGAIVSSAAAVIHSL